MSIFFKFQSHCPFGFGRETPSPHRVTYINTDLLKDIFAPRPPQDANQEEKFWGRQAVVFQFKYSPGVEIYGIDEYARQEIITTFQEIASYNRQTKNHALRSKVAAIIPPILGLGSHLIIQRSIRETGLPMNKIEARLSQNGHHILDLSDLQSAEYKKPPAPRFIKAAP